MYKFESSEGTLYCHADGTPSKDNPLPAYYSDIVMFDIERLEAMCEANGIDARRECGWDILAVGYWTTTGYEDPAPAYAENGIMIHIWKGEADDYDEAVTLGGDY